jgi:hypothetical protein
MDADCPNGLAVELNGWVCAVGAPTQLVGASLNGSTLGMTHFGHGSFAWIMPRPYRGGTVVVAFSTPNAVRPSDHGGSDTRRLGVAVQRVRVFAIDEPIRIDPPEIRRETPIDPELAMEFISLGDDCVLGLVQRAMHAEPLGLLRFSTSFLWRVLEGIESGWAGLGDALRWRLSKTSG